MSHRFIKITVCCPQLNANHAHICLRTYILLKHRVKSKTKHDSFFSAPFAKTCDTFIKRSYLACYLSRFISLLRFIEFFSVVLIKSLTINASGAFNYHSRRFACVFMAAVLLNFGVSSFINK